MPRDQFSRAIDVTAGQDACWRALTDVELMVSWVSVVDSARELSPLSKYTAVLADQLGPFRLRADLDVVLSDVLPGRRVHVHAEGEDRQVGSRIVVTGTLELRPHDAGTAVDVTGGYEVTGRVASLGGGMIRKKADRILDEFFGNVARYFGEA